MSQIKTIFKNMSWLFVSQIIASICGFIWTILIARYLGVNEYGILGFAISFSGILTILNDLGIGTHIVRHISTDNESSSEYLGNAIPLKCLFSVANFGLSLIILIIMKCNPVTIAVTLLFTLEAIIKSLYGLFYGAFQAFEEGKYQGISNTLLNLILLIFILIVIFTDQGLFGITFAYLFANIIVGVYTYYALQKHITKPIIKFDKTFSKKITIASIPFALSSLLYTIYYSIDVVMLTGLIGDYATGIYNATYKLISVLTMFYGIYLAVVFPVMSKLFKNDKKILMVSFEKSVKYLTLITIPLAIATMLYSQDIITLFYGHEYDAAAAPLSILIWTVCLLFINGAAATLLNASHEEVAVTKVNAIAAAFNILLNFYMIPNFSYNGAAMTTVLSDLLIFCLYLYIMFKINQKPNKKLIFTIVKIIIASAVLGISLYFLNLNMWIAIPVGVVIYLISITLLNFFDDDDKYILNEILGKKLN
jgi:O-antigen/teichoic acid export membrane protein